MKVVLFCGGYGMRLREYSESIPKPMVPIGYRPILWHIMKYYAHYGHKDFILCLGYKGDLIKNYFLNYNEAASNNFTLSDGGRKIELLNRDIHDWNITFVDTGMKANIGQRLKAVEPFLADEEVFLANYADGLTDLPLPHLIEHFEQHNAIASFVAVHPAQTFHVVQIDPEGLVDSIDNVERSNLWVNGGFFVLRRSIFDYMQCGEELVEQPFWRLIQQHKLAGYRYNGFWACMDTYKEMQLLDNLYSSGEAPWEVWRQPVINVSDKHDLVAA
jgi:glucose-1-phosphate cytidylyltransferase